MPHANPSTDTELAIQVRQLNMIYRSKAGDTQALKDADLDIARGEFVSLIGPSGCGKTTLLRLIANLIEASSGELHIFGQSARAARLARAYGYVFQAPALYEWRSIIDNVKLPLQIMRYPKREAQERAEAMLELVGLSDFRKQYPHQLSGRMQQRVSIARALAFDPKLLLMDEPFGALDEITRERLNDELLRIWQETQKTIVFVTHSISEAVFLSSKVVVMTPRPGKIERVMDIPFGPTRSPDIRSSPTFYELAAKVRGALRDAH